MADDAFDVAYVAKLARLQLSAEETQLFQVQLGQILKYVDELREVDVGDVDSAGQPGASVDVFREDEARDWFTAEEALRNAPRKTNGLFVVTKVLE